MYTKEIKAIKKMIANSLNKTLTLYENDQIIQIFYNVCFGKNGVTKNKMEGDMCTPVGIFSLGFAFGTKLFSTTYPYYQINDSVYWVSDSNSPFYNQWVELGKKRTHSPYSYMHFSKNVLWLTAEHLIDYPVQYEIALVIEYNLHYPIKNKGSAIFLHVKNKDYTSGCIAVTKEEMEYIIKWLEKGEAQIEIY